VWLPKPVAFPDNVREVEILKIGHSRLLVPKGKRWDDFFLIGPSVTKDFLQERRQPDIEECEPF